MATSSQDSVGNKFKCPLCTETFRSPKILRCLHTFCEQCIHEYLVSLARNKGSEIKEFSCPVCRTVSRPPNNEESVEKWASQLHRNAAMEAAVLASSGDKQQCHACQRVNEHNDAVIWCNECADALCESCSNAHRKIRLTIAHREVPLADFESSSKLYDLNAIVDTCLIHPGNMLVAICDDHNELCCSTCVCLDHRQCKKVTAMDVSKSPDTDEKCITLLKEMREEFKKLLTQKDQEKLTLKENVKSIEKEATEFFDEIKCKMDELSEAYCKQITVLHDELNTKLNVDIRLLEQVIKSLDHWIESTDVVRDIGQKGQLYVFVHMFKEQIKLCTEELSAKFDMDKTLKLDFKTDETAKSILSLIGNVVSSEVHHKNQMDNILGLCKQLKIKPNFDTLKVEYVRYIHYPNSSLSCGACIGDQVLFLGNIESKELLLVNCQNGQQICAVPFQNERGCTARRCLYDSQHSRLFISCNRPKGPGSLFRAGISCSDINDIRQIEFCNDYVGAMLRHENNVYIIVHRAIKTFQTIQDRSSRKVMSTVFTTNTDNDKSLGLGFYDGSLIYTTRDREVKRTSLGGTEIYCFKSENVIQPECLCVLPSGVTLVVDRSNNGSLHLISADGKRHRTLLEGFKHIKSPLDIFLNDDAQILYVIGGEYVEVYNIL